jgi:hypothetical protein
MDADEQRGVAATARAGGKETFDRREVAFLKSRRRGREGSVKNEACRNRPAGCSAFCLLVITCFIPPSTFGWSPMSFLPAVKIWIWVSVFASLAGWALSAFGFLNRIGYVVLGVVGLVVFIEMRARGAFGARATPWRWGKWRHRFARPFPLMFAALAVLALVSGAVYPPSNHTGLSYRIPRVLHWLQAEGWHWIYTPNPRLNTRACGIEWLSAPLLLFTKSDRGLFLLNFIPFLLLPGLVFSVLTRLGVRGRVAWPWMWLLPTGYVFLLQAGSAGNDAYPAVYALAAVDFACRAWKSRTASELWYSLLAVALLGGAKASNLPLTLAWLILIAPLWRRLQDEPLGTSRVVLVAILVSFLPTALLNLNYLGNWSGLSIERTGMDMKNPLVGVWGNALLLLQNNLCPPLFPFAGWWNQNALRLLPGFITRPLNANFEQGYQNLWELPTEDWAGVGAGVGGLMIISALWAVARIRQRHKSPFPITGITPVVRRLALLAPWLALVAYSAKSGMVTPGRLIAPYYPLLLPLLLAGAEQAALVRQRWWQLLAWLVFLVAFPVLIVTPARPLWPAQTILTRLVEAKPDSRLLKRALTTYSVYSIRSDPLPELRAQLPKGLKVLGFLGTPDDLDISFWRPYGARQVDQISQLETAEQIRQRKLQYAIVSGASFDWQGAMTNLTFSQWLVQTRAEVLTNTTATITVSAGPQPWYFVHFKD